MTTMTAVTKIPITKMKFMVFTSFPPISSTLNLSCFSVLLLLFQFFLLNFSLNFCAANVNHHGQRYDLVISEITFSDQKL